MDNILEVNQEIKNTKSRLENLYSQQKALMNVHESKPKTKFKCGCGKQHMLKDCIGIQTHWYTRPHGCIGGDYWNRGEFQIVCPKTDHKNRIMFDDWDVPYEDREKYEYDTEAQFISEYRNYFKEIIEDYDEDTRSSWNNYHFCKHRKKYGLVEKYRKK